MLFKVGAADISLRYVGCHKDGGDRDLNGDTSNINPCGVEQCARICHQQGW